MNILQTLLIGEPMVPRRQPRIRSGVAPRSVAPKVLSLWILLLKEEEGSKGNQGFPLKIDFFFEPFKQET